MLPMRNDANMVKTAAFHIFYWMAKFLCVCLHCMKYGSGCDMNVFQKLEGSKYKMKQLSSRAKKMSLIMPSTSCKRGVFMLLALIVVCGAAAHVVASMLHDKEIKRHAARTGKHRHRHAARRRREDVFTSIPLGSYDVIIVGAGLSGAVLAERHANVLGHKVLVLEKREHVAGNCFDYVDEETGIRVSRYGVHLFHTRSLRVWDYVSKFGKWKRWDHKVLAEVDGNYVNVPVNINTVNALFNASIQNSDEMDSWLASVQVKYNHPARNSEEMARSRVGNQLYEMLIEPYTRKQWNCSPADLDASVTGRIPVRNNFDDRYFTDKYQFLPEQGYTEIVRSMLSSGGGRIDVMLNTEFSSSMLSNFHGIVYYTGPIDQYFSYVHERLQYRSLEFKRVAVMNHSGTMFPVSQVNYPSMQFPYTRVVEYKHLLRQKSQHTVLYYEYSTDVGEPYYPVPSERNHVLYDKYKALALQETISRDVWFVGRLANYKYFNMDQAIGNALDYFEMYADLHVVLSVYDEDLSWTSQICSALDAGTRVAWFVYVKKEGRNDVARQLQTAACKNTTLVNITHLPNVGREAHSWATYITKVARPGRKVAFLQGGLDHARKQNWAQEIRNSLLPSEPFVSLSGPPGGPASGIFVGNVYNDWLLCCGTGDATTQLAKQVTGREDVDMTKLEHNFRAEFVVSGKNVLQVAHAFGRRFKDEWIPAMSKEDKPDIIYAMERLWMEIFRQGRIAKS